MLFVDFLPPRLKLFVKLCGVSVAFPSTGSTQVPHVLNPFTQCGPFPHPFFCRTTFHSERTSAPFPLFPNISVGEGNGFFLKEVGISFLVRLFAVH